MTCGPGPLPLPGRGAHLPLPSLLRLYPLVPAGPQPDQSPGNPIGPCPSDARSLLDPHGTLSPTASFRHPRERGETSGREVRDASPRRPSGYTKGRDGSAKGKKAQLADPERRGLGSLLGSLDPLRGTKG